MIITWKTIFGYLREKKAESRWFWDFTAIPRLLLLGSCTGTGLVSVDMDWTLFKHPETMNLNDHLTREALSLLLDEWDTKCALVDLSYRDGGDKFSSRAELFFKKEFIIQSILDRKIKDDSDTFVEAEYRKFLGSLKKHELRLLEGWESPDPHGHCWIGKTAGFSVNSSIFHEGDYISLVFFIPDISYYPDRRITVELDIDSLKNKTEVTSAGFHKITIPLSFHPKLLLKQDIPGTIHCSTDFIPSRVSDSPDSRHLSVLITKFELARKTSDNVVNVIRLVH